MMRIDSVASQPDRVGRHLVRFEDGTDMRLYRQTIQDFGIYAGAELTEESFAKLKDAASAMSAKMRAIRIVSASSVSRGDLQRRLIHKGEDPQLAEAAVAWMEEMDLIDDRKTAQQVVQRCIGKGYGLVRAKQALYEKRIPKQYWQEVLENYPDQLDAIVDFLRSRLAEGFTEKELRKATDALLRRGHTYGQIRAGLQELALDTEDLRED